MRDVLGRCVHTAFAQLRPFRVVCCAFSDTPALRSGTDSLIPAREAGVTWDAFLRPWGPSSGRSRRQSLCSRYLGFALHPPPLIHILYIEALDLVAENCGSNLSSPEIKLPCYSVTQFSPPWGRPHHTCLVGP